MDEETRKQFQEWGRRGGSVRSEAKREAARRRWAKRFGSPAPAPATPEAQPERKPGGPVLLIGGRREPA